MSKYSLVTRHSPLVILMTLLAFILRLPLNGDIPPRWDEGWSIAHASLGIGELLRITAADVHPPLYYLLLGVWQKVVGIDLFAARYLSVLTSVTAIPLAFAAARAWSGSTRIGMLAALLMAWLPLGVYYGAVVRMYALAPSFVLLAAYGASRLMTGDWSWKRRQPNFQSPISSIALFTLGAAGAMYTLYHAVWALAAIAVYGIGLAAFRRQWSSVRRLLIGIVISVGVYLPWAMYAVPQFLGRAATEATTNVGQQFSIGYFIQQGVLGLTLSQPVGVLGPITITVIIVVAIIVAVVRRKSSSLLLDSSLSSPGIRAWGGSQISILNISVLIIVFTLVGVAFAARQWAFNARMLICAVPALAMALAWAFDQLMTTDDRRPTPMRCRSSIVRRLPACIAAIALVAVYAGTSANFVYQKSLEVFEPYNPNTYHAHIAPHAAKDDAVFFNVLSPAGFYVLDRQPNDPGWSYALTWDPVIEPRQGWQIRIDDAARAHNRLWLVLYRGLAGKNGDLRGYMDSTYYPARAEWGEEDVFYGLYGVPRGPMAEQELNGAHWPALALSAIRVGTLTKAGDILPVALTWTSSTPITTNYKVFVHAAKPDGFVIAQHDAQPLNDLRPMTTWTVGEPVQDNHGLALPFDYHGPLTLAIGLYDPDTGQRLRTRDGRDAVVIDDIVIMP